MFAGLYIGLAALSGWTEAAAQAGIKTTGRLDLCTSHPGTRKAHQASKTALYILQHRAYKRYILAIPQILQ